MAGALRLVRSLGRGVGLAELLQDVATGVAQVLGFEAVAVNLVGPGHDLRVVAFSGPASLERLRGATTERIVMDDLLEQSEAIGSLRFIDHRGHQGRAASSKAAASEQGDATGGRRWQARDVLLAPMYSSSGALLGVLSLDKPLSGRLPGQVQCTLLEILAAQAANVIEDTQRSGATSDRQIAYRRAFDLVPVAMAIIDDSLVILDANHAFAQLVGKSAAAIAGTPFVQALAVEDAAHVVALCRATLSGSGDPSSIEHRYRLRGPHQRWALSSFTLVRSLLSPDRIIVRSDDVTADRRAHLERGTRAYSDTLTGVPNRRAALEQVEVALSRRDRAHQVCVLYLDLDGFAQINDAYGHAAGDEVIRITSQRLQVNLRVGEQLFRIGDDELIVLCEGLRDRRRVESLAERLIVCTEPRIVLPSATVSTSLSIGIAFASDGGPAVTAPEILEAARKAVGQAKGLGRGRWYSAPPADRRGRRPGDG